MEVCIKFLQKMRIGGWHNCREKLKFEEDKGFTVSQLSVNPLSSSRIGKWISFEQKEVGLHELVGVDHQLSCFALTKFTRCSKLTCFGDLFSFF